MVAYVCHSILLTHKRITFNILALNIFMHSIYLCTQDSMVRGGHEALQHKQHILFSSVCSPLPTIFSFSSFHN